MFRAILAVSARRRAAILSSAVLGVLLPAAAQANSLSIDLHTFNPATGTGHSNNNVFLDNSGTPVPIYIYGTVTGTNPINPVPVAGSTSAPATTGNFQGIQYTYYNIFNSGANEIVGSVNTPALNTTLGFNGNGSQLGSVPSYNLSGGLALGSTSSNTGVAKARAGGAVFDDFTTGGVTVGNDGANIKYSNGNKTVSFLLETLFFTPTAASFTPGKTTTFSVQLPTNLGIPISDANWFEDTTAKPAPNTQPGGGKNAGTGTYVAGTTVTFTDALQGDADLSGSVSSNDLLIVLQNFGPTAGGWKAGDFDKSGAVDSNDLLKVLQNFGGSLGSVSGMVAENQAVLADPSAVAVLNEFGISTAVPEPTSLGLVGIAGAALLARRRRRA